MKLQHDKLKLLIRTIFAEGGCQPPEDERIAHYLVESNLVGHNSHGVIRDRNYIAWLHKGMVNANQTLRSGMLVIVLDPDRFPIDVPFSVELAKFVDWVKSSRLAMPGEPETRTRALRLKEGIDLDDNTWCQNLEGTASVGVTADEAAAMVGVESA